MSSDRAALRAHGPGHRSRLHGVGLALLLLAAARAPAMAQEVPVGALNKTELVRLLVSDTYSTPEKLDIVRGVCLRFEPGADDWQDIRKLAPDPRLLRAIEECVKLGPIAEVSLDATRRRARVGQTLTVTVTVTRRGRPEPGVPIRLEGRSGRDARLRVEGVTNEEGRATLRLPGRRAAGRSVYAIRAKGRDVRGSTRLEVLRLPDAAAAVRLAPDTVRVSAALDATDTLLVAATVLDRYGNAVPGVLPEVSAPEDSAATPAASVTDGGGRTVFHLGGDRLARAQEKEAWEVRVGKQRLGALVVAPEPALAPAPTPLAAAAVETAEPGPDPVDVRIEAAYELLKEGHPDEAEAAFRSVLRLAPRRLDAQRGLAAALLDAGRAQEAVLWWEVVAGQLPDDPDAWDGLARAYTAAGRQDDARQAWAQVTSLDPTRATGGGAQPRRGPTPGFFEILAWGGGTLDNDTPGRLRRLVVAAAPAPAIRLEAGFDRSLGPAQPERVRGPDEWKEWFGRGTLSWGPGGRLSTALGAGRRDQGFDLVQNTVTLEQRIRLPATERSVELSVGGFLGRWFDRDDWSISAGAEAGVGPGLDLVTRLVYGRTIGTNWLESGRHADGDGRLYAGLAYRSAAGLRVQPLVGVGHVSSDREGLSGALVDLSIDARIPVGGAGRILLYARHQRPPGTRAFTVLAAGFALRLGWGGG